MAAPWLLAALLAGLGAWSRSAASGAGGHGDGRPVTTAAGETPAVVASEPASRTAPSSAVAPAVIPAPLVPPTAELAVVAAARAALGSAGLVGATADAADRWPLRAEVVEVTHVTGRLGVATVHALVIERTPDGWGAPRTLAVAVPLSLEGEVAVAGPAWPLPAPTTTSVDVVGRPVADPDPGLVASLLDLGWAVDDVVTVDLLDGGVLRVRLRGTAPGDRAASTHEVWLLDAPGGTRLLPPSTTDRAAATAPPAPPPTEDPTAEEST